MNKILIIHKLILESEELSDKILKLEEFMRRDEFEELSPTQKGLLSDQYDTMRDYLTILLRRIVDLNEGSV